MEPIAETVGDHSAIEGNVSNCGTNAKSPVHTAKVG
jgi:hypothetical protein